MDVKTAFCLLAAAVTVVTGFPAKNQNGPGRRLPPPLRVLIKCSRELSWPEIRDANCSEHEAQINSKIDQIYGGEENEYFLFKLRMIRRHGNNDLPCEKIACFKRTIITKIISDGMPSFCDGRTEEAPEMPESGMASLMVPANQDVLIELMKDGFCFGMNKLSIAVQAKIIKHELGLRNHGMPLHVEMVQRFRERMADCDNYDEEIDCTELNPDAYVTAMYGTPEEWNQAVEEKKEKMMGKMRNGQGQRNKMRKCMCTAKKCFGDSLEKKIKEMGGEMPSGCHPLYQRRREIFKDMQIPPTNDQIKLISCNHAFKASMEFRMKQDDLQCNGNVAATMNDLFSEDESEVARGIQTIRTAWERAGQSDRQESHGIPDALVCRFKAIVEKLNQEDSLPGFCTDEAYFDADRASVSDQDIKGLLCFEMEKFQHMFRNYDAEE